MFSSMEVNDAMAMRVIDSIVLTLVEPRSVAELPLTTPLAEAIAEYLRAAVFATAKTYRPTAHVCVLPKKSCVAELRVTSNRAKILAPAVSSVRSRMENRCEESGEMLGMNAPGSALIPTNPLAGEVVIAPCHTDGPSFPARSVYSPVVKS